MTDKIVLDLGPKMGNPRNSEGDFIRLKDGRILFVYSAYQGTSGGDNAYCRLEAVESRDEGESWSESRVIFTPEDIPEATNLMSVSFERMADGAVGLFFLRKTGNGNNCNLMLARSYDEGDSWSTPILCVAEQGFFVTNNDRICRTSTGRLLAPANKVVGPSSTSEMHVLYSDDDGLTWHKGPQVVRMPFGLHSGLQESGFAEFTPGVITAYHRTGFGYQYFCQSEDDGMTWSDPLPNRFFSAPVSPMKIDRLRDGRWVAVWNPIPNYNGRYQGDPHWGRTPLAMAVSPDGKAWTRVEDVEGTNEDGQERGLCYPAVMETDKGILCAYCAGGLDDGCCLQRLRVRLLPLP